MAEVTNKQLLHYCQPFFEEFGRRYRDIDKFPRIDVYTKESGYVVISIYPVKEKTRQGIVIYEANQEIDEPVEPAGSTNYSWYIAKMNKPENWDEATAQNDLKSAIDKAFKK